MSKQGQNYLLESVRKAIEYCAREYDMTWAEAIGCLEMIKHYYVDLAFDLNMDKEEEETEEEEEN